MSVRLSFSLDQRKPWLVTSARAVPGSGCAERCGAQASRETANLDRHLILGQDALRGREIVVGC